MCYANMERLRKVEGLGIRYRDAEVKVDISQKNHVRFGYVEKNKPGFEIEKNFAHTYVKKVGLLAVHFAPRWESLLFRQKYQASTSCHIGQ